MQRVQAGEIHVASIHDVDSTRFGKQHIERMDIVQFAVGYVDEAWNVATQIEQRVHLHCCPPPPQGQAWSNENAPKETPTDTDRWSSSRAHTQCWANPRPDHRRHTTA